MTLTDALGWSLLHFLWQGALIGLLLLAALAVLRNARAETRYAASCSAMLMMLICIVVTFLELRLSGNHASAPSISNPAHPVLTPPHFSLKPLGAGIATLRATTTYLPVLVWAWLCGVLALSIRSLGGWVVARRFARRHTSPAEVVWNERFVCLAKRLSISRPVSLAVSAIAQVPAVVGWTRPVILVPAAVFTGLPAEQVEALFAHELAHVRRFDYLINLLQTAVETLLFYHPVVWWVSRNIRNEREHCCDDIAVEFCGSALIYAQALTRLEQIVQGAPALAMAANGGSLLQRIQRLLQINQTSRRASGGWIAAAGILIALLVTGIAGWAQHTDARAVSPVPPPAPAAQITSPPAPPVSPVALDAPNPPSLPDRPDPPDAQARGQASPGWLDEIEAEGYRGLSVDQLISLKTYGVTGEYIRQVNAAMGTKVTVDQLVSFRVYRVTPDFIKELKQAGLRELKPDDLIALKVYKADPAAIREIQSLGFPNISVNDIVSLRVYRISPKFIQDAQKRFKNITVDQIVSLKMLGILNTQ